MKWRRVFIFFIGMIFWIGLLYGQSKFSRSWVFDVELGNWQPQSLRDQVSFLEIQRKNTLAMVGIGMGMPVGRDVGLRVSSNFWVFSNVQNFYHVHSLSFHSVNVDLKHWLVPESWLSAYVLYGGSVYWGVENQTTPFNSALWKARPGWGLNLGAGFDVMAKKFFGMGMVFQYRFVRLNHLLAGTDDYSGPQIGFFLYYQL